MTEDTGRPSRPGRGRLMDEGYDGRSQEILNESERDAVLDDVVARLAEPAPATERHVDGSSRS